MGTSQNVQAPPVLLVEDDPEDVYIARRAFERGKLDRPLRVVGDGREALEYLDRTGRYAVPAQAPRPALILLDLNLPYVSGLDVPGACEKRSGTAWHPGCRAHHVG